MAIFDWLLGREADAQTFAEGTTTSTREAFEHAKEVPVGDFRFVALDVETACGDVASICQIGLACVDFDNAIETYSLLVDPDTEFDRFNMQLHGITPSHVLGAPIFPDALDAILPLLATHHLIQHSNFDKQAVNAACRQYQISIPDLRWSDSVAIARRAWPELKGNGGHGLANLKKVLNLEFQHHDAGEDARAAAMVVLHAEDHLSMPLEELVLKRPRKSYSASVTRKPDIDGPLRGLFAVFTGNLSMTREEAADLAAGAGMAITPNVTKKTTFLVVGDQVLSVLAGHTKSTKHRKAEKMRDAGHPIRIVNETEFKYLVNTSREM